MKLVERFSAGLALLAFSAVLILGIITGISVEKVLLRGVVAIVIFFLIGYMSGAITRLLIKENISGVKGENPLKDTGSAPVSEEKKEQQVSTDIEREEAVDESTRK